MLAAVSDAPPPGAWELSVYCFWRDLGYAIGAVLVGLLAGYFGLTLPITDVGGVTLLSGVMVVAAMRDRSAG